MFGKNPIRKQVKDDGSSLVVQEIFYTMQGEGPHSGTPAVFLRLAGCNLACTFCDTEFESMIDNVVPIMEIADEVHGCFPPTARAWQEPPLVVLTGGEPMRQNITPLLVHLILSKNFRVQIETAGTVFPESLDPDLFDGKLSFVCSPKTGKVHPRLEDYCLDWKYIICVDDPDRYGDGLPNRSTQSPGLSQKLYRPSRASDTVWLQAMDSHDEQKSNRNLHEAVHRCMKYGYRLSLQQHKILGLP